MFFLFLIFVTDSNLHKHVYNEKKIRKNKKHEKIPNKKPQKN